jgi:hypothetical protein
MVSASYFADISCFWYGYWDAIALANATRIKHG